MNKIKSFGIIGLLFVIIGIVYLINDNTALAFAFITLGLAFGSMSQKNKSKKGSK